jgi:hypothetical protein
MLEFGIIEKRVRTPEPKFSAENFGEAVPRPKASGGELLSRGRIPPSPPACKNRGQSLCFFI